jgi:hypothetical protein
LGNAVAWCDSLAVFRFLRRERTCGFPPFAFESMYFWMATERPWDDPRYSVLVDVVGCYYM